LELGSIGKTIHGLIIDHMILEDPKAVGNYQEVGDNTNSPKRLTLDKKICWFNGNVLDLTILPQAVQGEGWAIQCDPGPGPLIVWRACKGGKQGRLLHAKTLEQAELDF